MKAITHYFVAPVFLATLLVTASLAYAQEETLVEIDTEVGITQEERQANREVKRSEIEADIAQRQENRIELQEERRAALEEKAQERITNLAANMSNRMEAIIARIQNIINRMDERITKLADRGLDTAEAEAALASAQLSIDAAAAAISTIDVNVKAAVGAEDALAAWAGVRLQYQSIKDHIKTAHTELRTSVAALKTAAAQMEDARGVSDAVRTDAAGEADAEVGAN